MPSGEKDTKAWGCCFNVISNLIASGLQVLAVVQSVGSRLFCDNIHCRSTTDFRIILKDQPAEIWISTDTTVQPAERANRSSLLFITRAQLMVRFGAGEGYLEIDSWIDREIGRCDRNRVDTSFATLNVSIRVDRSIHPAAMPQCRIPTLCRRCRCRCRPRTDVDPTHHHVINTSPEIDQWHCEHWRNSCLLLLQGYAGSYPGSHPRHVTNLDLFFVSDRRYSLPRPGGMVGLWPIAVSHSKHL